ncbi:MAG: AAA family ATPase [Candidatus Aenigmarchaeota archaeon]|nr:AAA family ATPase [Candidatus Aenigmarchaeota archaeon]
MILKSLHLKNIRSYVDERMEFPEGPLLLAGDIGSGKSTILLAMDFALFGTRRGELEGSELLRHGQNYGSVDFCFSIDGKDVEIKRVIRRSSSIAQDAGLLTINKHREELTPTELKAKILELFGYPKDALTKNTPIFRYTVYTPQEQMKRILDSADNRLNILRKIFGIDKYGQIRNNARIFLTELRAAKKVKQESARDLDEKVRQLEEKEKSKVLLEKDIRDLAGKLGTINNELSSKIAEREGIKARIEAMYKIKSLLAQKESEKRSKESRLIAIKTEMEKLAPRMEKMKNDLRIYYGLGKPDTADAKSLDAVERERDKLMTQRAVIINDTEKLKAIYESGKCAVCGQAVSKPNEFKANIDTKAHLEKDFAFRIVQLDEELKRLKSLQEAERKYKSETEKKELIEKNLSDMEERKADVESEKSFLETGIKNLASEAGVLSHQTSEFEDINKTYNALEDAVKSLQSKSLETEKIKSRLEQQTEDAEEYIKLYAGEIEKKKKDKEMVARIDELNAWMDGYFISLMEIIERHVMTAILKEFDATFQKWFGILMNDELQVRLDSQFSPVIEQNGYETEFQNLSGGEKTSVALAYRLALNNVINSMIETIKTKDIIILDEPTDGFSADQLDKIRDVINELKLRQIIIVSHEPKIDSFVDNVIRLYKEGHVSRIANN